MAQTRVRGPKLGRRERGELPVEDRASRVAQAASACVPAPGVQRSPGGPRTAPWTALEERNQSAAASLEEGLEETLTLHRLGVYGVLGRSFKTTNCLESVDSACAGSCPRRGKVREGRSLEELEPAAALVGDGAHRHRTTLEEGDRLPSSSKAPRSPQAGAED